MPPAADVASTSVNAPGATRVTGIATPVEAAGIGSFGALFVSAVHRRLDWVAIQEAAIATLKATAMVMWIFFGATMFVGFFIVKGGQTFVANSILGTGLPPYGIPIGLAMAALGWWLTTRSARGRVAVTGDSAAEGRAAQE